MEFVVITLQDTTFSYRAGKPVLNRVSLHLDAGLTLLVGPNGSGKSTLLKILAGIERPDSGCARILGCDLWEQEVKARRKLAYVPDHPDLTPYATIREVIHFVCSLRHAPPAEAEAVLERAGLTLVADRSIRELSMGQRRRALFAAAWIGSPRIVLLDEPLEAMDREMCKEIVQWVDRLIEAGAAVVIATHQIEPFLGKVARCLTLSEGSCRFIEQPLR